MGFGGMYYILWILKRDLPKRDKRVKEDYKKELEKVLNLNPTYMSVTDIAVFYNIEPAELNKIFIKLKWAEQSGKWWVATQLGFKKGAKQEYNTRNKVKYIIWKNSIKKNFELIQEVNKLKENNKSKNMTTKEKGDKYEAFVADFFRKQGYYVWEHGKEKGVKDSNIDLFVKKEKYIYFIQCKDWKTWKLDHHKVKATRTDVREYLKVNQEFWKIIKNYELKILYITSKECLTKGAYTYIQKNNSIVEYQVIPIEENRVIK